ncbi:hypothetical protein A2716_04800 [candidate division WWE3 bacterium RIFCSPHIGHO2_01_FULL_40_23]|uniref:Putative pre-16S rRNA nuclease n=1 Tax=candidate division WWE3 bacterium RIFCSPLOWO2_01_FULL_41_18 TaxID=1802625 RepID=A0A1F4VDF9_UNCKA|nr:MAG: hypothetical protein A2716_04800 [candidate division WWE3 bacterium RIFCSPHIGHO2_01_FULL_40_23]OGC55189.1 MAG: hypothetical protein A3A78_04410 [candidate division WWE3 bacterium RIFCSPLOWO2_01_FULL_41_18]
MRNEGSEKVLGVDLGDRNVGLAFGSSGLTMPLTRISSTNREEILGSILKTVIDNKINKVIVGLPLLPDGKSTPQTLKVRTFVKRLKSKLRVPVETVDEFMSTKEALKKAVDFGASRKGRNILDSLSAEIIVKRYFESQREKEAGLLK